MADLEGTAGLALTLDAPLLLSGDSLHTRSLWRRIDTALLHSRVLIPLTVHGVTDLLHTRMVLGRTSGFDLLHTRQILDPAVAGLWNDDIQRPIGRVNLT